MARYYIHFMLYNIGKLFLFSHLKAMKEAALWFGEWLQRTCVQFATSDNKMPPCFSGIGFTKVGLKGRSVSKAEASLKSDSFQVFKDKHYIKCSLINPKFMKKYLYVLPNKQVIAPSTAVHST